MDYMAPWNDDDNADAGIGGMGAELGPGDLANLLVKLTDNALSGAMFERRAAARGVLEAFKQSCFAEEDTMNVIAVIEQLVNDQEQLVRQEIMEQLPEVALFCHEEGPYLDFVVPQHILPHIVKLITDKFSQVRKAAQTGLLSLLEKGIIAPRQVAEQVCPVILEYTEPNAMDDYRTEVTGFMSKLARFVGKEIVVKWFLERYCALCQDPMFQVRRVCASSMGEIAFVIGTRLTEAVLLPEFLALCKDDVWGVRKGCAEVFTDIARLCQLPTRRDKLTPAFVKLLEDCTRWVKVAAYQTLGPFITTFSVESDIPVEIPELTEFEKNFIERVKDSPSMLAFEGKGHLQKNSMMGSESTEDLTSICIQDDEEDGDNVEEKLKNNVEDEKEVATSKREMNECEEMTEEEAKEKLSLLTKKFAKLYRQNQVGSPTSKSDFSSLDFLPDCTIELTERHVQKPHEKDDGSGDASEVGNQVITTHSDNSASSPIVSVHNASGNSGGVHIHVKKEATQELTTQICRSSSVLSHRPSSISSHAQRSNSTSQNVTSPLSSATTTVTATATTSVVSSGGNNVTLPTEPTTYNTFQYWRIPLPDIELDIGLVEGKPTSVQVRAKVEDPTLKLTYASEISVNLSSDVLTKTTSSPIDEITTGDTSVIGLEDQVKVENLQIQTISSSSFSDESEQTTKLESSLSNTTVSLLDGRVMQANTSCMDLYNVSANNKDCQIIGCSTGSGSLISGGGGLLEDFALDMSHLDGFDEDSDDQLSTCTYPFRDEPKKPRLLQELPKSSVVIKQDVVPDILLDHFTGMSHDGDPELAPCCVFNLPAVVLTLGPQYWSVLRDCYENLASSLQWKVRYTLAACLHEIANILGPELSERDLIPFYNALMKDLDEVRIGVLKHLACFFKIVGVEERKKCLRTIKSFIKTDNPRNWRFRLELVYQIQQLVDMFEMDDVFKHVCPVCIDLIKDNVAEIRKESLHAVIYVVKRLNECHAAQSGAGDPNAVHEFLSDLVKSLSESSKWVRRQTFAALSGQLIATNALYPSQFAQDILPHLIGLSEDKVPNVRLCVAKSIVTCVLQQDCFNDPLNPHSVRVLEALTKLQQDSDQDVRYYSQRTHQEDENDFEEENQLIILAEK